MTKNEPSADLDTIKADIIALRDDLTSATGSALREGAKSVKNATKAVADQAASAVDHVQEFVKERPVTAILIAFGSGLIISRLLRRS